MKIRQCSEAQWNSSVNLVFRDAWKINSFYLVQITKILRITDFILSVYVE